MTDEELRGRALAIVANVGPLDDDSFGTRVALRTQALDAILALCADVAREAAETMRTEAAAICDKWYQFDDAKAAKYGDTVYEQKAGRAAIMRDAIRSLPLPGDAK